MDVEILHDHRSTEHRVILGREYYESYGLQPQDSAAVIFELLLQKKVVRQNEGMLWGEIHIFALCAGGILL